MLLTTSMSTRNHVPIACICRPGPTQERDADQESSACCCCEILTSRTAICEMCLERLVKSLQPYYPSESKQATARCICGFSIQCHARSVPCLPVCCMTGAMAA